ncbi:hypothetical protein, partial [Staphylococcus haemolyticus]
KKDNFYIISIEIVFFSLIQELYVPDSWFLWEMNINVLVTVRTRYCHSTSSKICFVTINNTKEITSLIKKLYTL